MGILHASGVPCVVQAVQIGWSHTCVAVALAPRTGRLRWAWQKNMQGEEPAIGGRVWDGVRGHTGEVMQTVDVPQAVPPPYAPIRTRWSASSRNCAGPQGPRRSGPAGQAGRAGADPEGLAGRSGAGVATVRLGLAPEGPDNLAADMFDVSAITLILGRGYSFVEIRGRSIGTGLRLWVLAMPVDGALIDLPLVFPRAGDTQPATLNRGPGISTDQAARLHHEQDCGGAASPGRVAGRNHLARPVLFGPRPLAGAPN